MWGKTFIKQAFIHTVKKGGETMQKLKGMMIIFLIIIAALGCIFSKPKETEEVVNNELQTKIVLYYTNPKNGELEKEYHSVSLKEIEKDIIGTIVKEQIKDPQNKELINQIPKGTVVNQIVIKDDKAIIDLSKEFKENEENELAKMQKIYAIVNAVTEVKEINEVEIDVEGTFYTQKKRL